MSGQSTGGTDRFLHIDLCTGLGGWRAPFEESDTWRSVGIDIRDDLNADVVGDVRALPFDCSPDLLTASPPCTPFSRYSMPWLDEPNPDMSLVEASLAAVDELNNRQGVQVLRIDTDRTTEWVWPRTNGGFIARNRVGPRDMAVTITLIGAEVKRHIKRANYTYEFVADEDVPIEQPPDVAGGDRDA